MTEDDQTKNAFTRIEDISAQNRPLIAGPDDTVVGFDELGGTVYRSKTGQEYTLYPETKTKQERPIVTAAKAVGEYLSDPSLPSLEETSEFAKEAVKGAYEPFRKIASGDNPTYGDLVDVTGSLAGGSAATAGKSILKNDPTQLNIFAGLGAQNADFNAFKKARKLKSQGFSPKNIEAQTGWNEGDDGFWRFEIDDRKAKVDRAAISGNKKPSEILDHPELFQNYDLDNNLTISFKKDLGGAWGMFTPGSNTIYLDPKLNDKDLKKTLLHEIQHFVQFKESFAGGSNPEWESLYGADPEVSKLRSELNLLQSSNSSPDERNKVTKDLYKAAYKAYRRNYGEVEANVVGERSNRNFLGKVKDTLLGRELAVDALEREKTRTKFAEGGMVEEDQMKRLMQEGGMTDDGMSIEPVTGNEIPPGSLSSEVRDDIPAQLSEGEYIIPADVVRFFGVRFFEELRNQAKQGLAKMDADGRIGGTPVDSQGVPMEDQDEELTPEEQQMLMEALGASGTPAGMAYGGMVTQTPANPYPLQDMSVPLGMAEGGDTAPFDRTKFSLGTGQTGIEQRKYINPTTKEERTINFLNGTPLGIVPEGFVPWTQELADAAKEPETETPTTAVEKVEREGRDRDQQGTGTAENSYENWAKENYDAITSDPYSFGVNAINEASKKATGIGRIFSGGIIGDIQKLDAISDAQAALSRVTDAAQKQDLQSRIDALTGSLSSPIVGLMTDIGFTATGKQKNAAIDSIAGAAASARTGTTSGAVAPASKGQDKGISVGYGEGKVDPGLAAAAAASKDKNKDKDKGISVGYGEGKVDPGLAAGVSKGKENSTSSGGNKSYGGQAASNRSGGAFAPGGLVTKKPTTRKPKKGLAS